MPMLVVLVCIPFRINNDFCYHFIFIGWMKTCWSSLVLNRLKWPDHHKRLGFGIPYQFLKILGSGRIFQFA